MARRERKSLIDWKENGKKIAVISTILILVVLGIFLYREQMLNRKQAEKIAQLNEKAKTYQEEIEQIESDLRSYSRKIKKRERVATGSIAFIVSSVQDLEKMQALMADRGIPAAVVLEDIQESEGLYEVIPNLVDKELAVIVRNQNNEGAAQVTQITEMLQQYGEVSVPYVLVKTEDDKEAYFSELAALGCKGVMRYREKLDSGMKDQGIPYVPYSIVRKTYRLDERIQQFVKQPADMVMIFDLAAVEQGAIPESELIETLDQMQQIVQDGKLQLCSIGEMMQMVQEEAVLSETQQKEYEAYVIEQEKKLEELKQQLSTLYTELEEHS